MYLSGRGKHLSKINQTVLIDSYGQYIPFENYFRLFCQTENSTTVIFIECDRLIDEDDNNCLISNDGLEDNHRGRVIVKYSAKVGKIAKKLANFCVSDATWDWICKVKSNLA